MNASPSEPKLPIATRVLPRAARRLAFAGSLDACTLPDARARLADALELPVRELVVDLAAVDRLDSYGVQALLAARARLAEHGGRLVVHGAKGQPRFVLERLGLTSLLDAS